VDAYLKLLITSVLCPSYVFCSSNFEDCFFDFCCCLFVCQCSLCVYVLAYPHQDYPLLIYGLCVRLSGANAK
jgi:hypothetical protein